MAKIIVPWTISGHAEVEAPSAAVAHLAATDHIRALLDRIQQISPDRLIVDAAEEGR